MAKAPDYEQALRDRAGILAKVQADPNLKSHLWGACYHDPVFFIETFCWADNVKRFCPIDVPAVPFQLFDFQKEMVREVVAAVEAGEPILIEKSRQMGASWVLAVVLLWGWNFRNWKCKMVSRSGEEVDKLGSIDSFLEKIRFNLRLLPDWMLPSGFKMEDNATHMLISRPDGTGIIRGETANPNASRGGSYDITLLDEFAFFMHASAINAAALFSSRCVVYNSTANGEFDEYYRMRQQAVGNKIRGLRYHWSEHPFYTQAWYEREKEKIGDPVKIARELDIDYAGSVQGRVYPNFRPIENGGDVIVGEFKHTPGSRLVVSIDNAHGAGENTDPNAVTVWQLPASGETRATMLLACEFHGDPTDTAYVLAKRPRAGYVLSARQMAFLDAWRELPGAFAFVSDPYDTNSAMLSTTIAKEYAKVGITLLCPDLKHDVESRIFRTRSNLRRLKCDSRQVEFMQAIANARYPSRPQGSQATTQASKPVHDATSHFRTATEYFFDWWLDEEARLTVPSARSIVREIADPVTGEIRRKEIKLTARHG